MYLPPHEPDSPTTPHTANAPIILPSTLPPPPAPAMPPTSRLATLNELPLPTFLAQLWPRDDPRVETPGPADGGPWRVRLRASDGLSEAELTACFRLVRDSSAADYGASASGWRPGRKREEMRLRDLRYMLLGRSAAGGEPEGEECLPVGGFLSFMLTWEDGIEVIYCYEIHLDESVRGRGVGKRLMGHLEEVGRKAGVEKAMLTVFKRNKAAMQFYERLGYEEDEYSPRPKKLRNGVVKELDYLIMSKSLIGGVKNHQEEGQRKRKAG
ncbi:hypothetical protein HO133_008298 [Letharia lupina]|uniref:N-alpha-acetyltransferase 40 n=1 Tax=Letharia lupina TaxID=560253 RepID=A0A8H6CNV6_9LECA|nr:uncharacterized protein HO133_008298 [Letharia lupina]KAF6226857.1 hypothetical protein HO133_008298 [Letharia lupina]